MDKMNVIIPQKVFDDYFPKTAEGKLPDTDQRSTVLQKRYLELHVGARYKGITSKKVVDLTQRATARLILFLLGEGSRAEESLLEIHKRQGVHIWDVMKPKVALNFVDVIFNAIKLHDHLQLPIPAQKRAYISLAATVGQGVAMVFDSRCNQEQQALLGEFIRKDLAQLDQYHRRFK